MIENQRDERVLIVAPVGQDGAAMAGLLNQEGVVTKVCLSLADCCEAITEGAGAVLVTEEALALSGLADLLAVLERQPAWSELPVIILTSGGESRLIKLLELTASAAGSVTLLERPMNAATLLRSVQVALSSRRRQYRVCELLEEQERKRREVEEAKAKAEVELAERKRMQLQLAAAKAELQQHADTLEDTVKERTAKLREMIQELEAFSYSIAHDMRAPLRAMQGFSAILEQEHASQLDETARSYLRRITSSAARMDRLITDILNYSKVVRGELEMRPVDVEKLTSGIIESYPELQSTRVDLTVERPLPLVLGNEAALTQVISNLLGNAVKFVAPGVRPRVRIRAERTQERAGLGNGAVTLWFEDNGIGIPEDSYARLFNIFTRLHRPGLYEGTGIGLAIVKKAVERMGGKVGVESEPGKGSRFWVQLKRA